MGVIIKKFGGSSVADIDGIRRVAARIAEDRRTQPDIVVVVSAMGQTTDELFAMAYGISRFPSQRELDMLLTAGERISMSLLSLALHEHGIDSISFTGSQSGIITDARHGNARILRVSAFRLREELARGKVVIVAGFQGVSTTKEVTTLGRGGSDTTAVALACYLDAERCEICKDVDGVYTADPRFVPAARRLDSVTYEQMLTLSCTGAGVLHSRAVEFADHYRRPIEITSSRQRTRGTRIVPGEAAIARPLPQGDDMEARRILALTSKKNLVCYTCSGEESAGFWDDLNRDELDIFWYEFSGSGVILYIDNAFSECLERVLAKHDMTYECIRELAAITLVGHNIWNDFSLVGEVRELLRNCSVARVTHGTMHITFFFAETYEAEALCLLHEKFIETNDSD
ncbi:MAG: aspartate kinase [Candidatus Cloacimonetes bacterium]|nr:aspartate kinase [Candidatus Cloacimonadota bacterium]